MARIKIEDLPVLEDLNEKQMKGIFGGYYTPPSGMSGSIQLNTGSTTQRQSPRTDFGQQFRSGVGTGANVVSGAVGVAAPFVPGAAEVANAIAGKGESDGQNQD